MRRVVVTGIGIVSSIGNDQEEVRRSLQEGRSGIVFVPEYKEMGFRSHVHGSVKLDPDTASFAILSPFPGTEVADMAEEAADWRPENTDANRGVARSPAPGRAVLERPTISPATAPIR